MSGSVDGKPFLRTWASVAGSGTPFALKGPDFWTVIVNVRVRRELRGKLIGSGREAASVAVISTDSAITQAYHRNYFCLPQTSSHFAFNVKEIAACLSTLTNLQELALGFQFSLACRHQTSQHPLTRSVLPALSSLRFLGTHEYLEDLLSRIDLPLLDNVDIILTHLTTFHALLGTAERDVPEGYEEQDLAEASRIALAGADDMMDMELGIDEADAEVGSIMTAAQSRVHSRHVLRLSAAVSYCEWCTLSIVGLLT